MARHIRSALRGAWPPRLPRCPRVAEDGGSGHALLVEEDSAGHIRAQCRRARAAHLPGVLHSQLPGRHRLRLRPGHISHTAWPLSVSKSHLSVQSSHQT